VVGIVLTDRFIQWGTFTCYSLTYLKHTPFAPGEALGFTLRVVSRYYPTSSALFSIQRLFIVCSPAAFLAFNYILYGRLISYSGAGHSIVKPRRVATIFVTSDISTFLMQVRSNLLSGVCVYS